MKHERALSDRGFTLVELMVTLSLLSLVLGVTFAFLTGAQTQFGTARERANIVTQARLGLEQMDREVRSGSVVRDPETESPANYTLRVLTQANNLQRCVQWQVADGRLQRRHWTPSYGLTPDPGSVSQWRTVAESVINGQVGVLPFEAAIATVGRVRAVRVVLVVDSRPGSSDTLPVRVEQTLNARNTSFNFPQVSSQPGASTEPCNPLP